MNAIIICTIVHSVGDVARIFKTKLFAKFARRERIADPTLTDAVDRAGRGQVDADLGGGIIKQRVARAGQGRSGGYRTLIAYRSGSLAVFMFGFAKNEMDNIDETISNWRPCKTLLPRGLKLTMPRLQKLGLTACYWR